MSRALRVLLPLLFLISMQAAPASETLVVRAERMLDVVSGELVEPGVVVVEGERIVAVNPETPPAGVRTLDLGDLTLLPGLIDAHVHVTFNIEPGYRYQLVTDSTSEPWLCWEGPGPKFPDIGGVGEGDIVQVVALGEEPGWVVILHPKYMRRCYIQEDVLIILHPEILEQLERSEDPELPPECPPGFKYDYDLGECVKKETNCRSIKNEKKCNNTPGCWWDPGVDECY